MNKNRVLGKGLSALIQGADLTGVPPRPVDSGGGIAKLPLANIGVNPNQPRKIFHDNELNELAESIKQVGILQPVLVRRLQPGQTAVRQPGEEGSVAPLEFCVVAGERRVRAARLAGLNDVPAMVVSYEQTEALKVALLENIQREDLGPVEEATAYRQLMNEYGATQEEVAAMLGKSRSGVANLLRLLTLEEEILELLQERHLTTGHGKALLGLPPGPARVQLAKLCRTRGLSVRDCERRVQAGGAKPRRGGAKKRAATADDPSLRALTARAEAVYGSPVTIERDARTGKGTVSVRFFNDGDLIRLLQIMGVDTEL
jgi:ParB family chromosome partitioning protein